MFEPFEMGREFLTARNALVVSTTFLRRTSSCQQQSYISFYYLKIKITNCLKLIVICWLVDVIWMASVNFRKDSKFSKTSW